ncbi:MAG: hypothetical protein KF898_03370 [Parachlamydiales bacterium]|nr:hypothetical protein [Verrucomicrobiota bacterium]MBX3718671.1 hypothetical protein [Candidatus Acheromyda pituitae]
MYKKITLLSLTSFCLLLLLWAVCFGKVRESDYASYREQKQSQQDTSVKSLAQTTNQNRKGVVKEIYFTQEDQSRLHYRIESDSSILTLKPEGSKFDLIEKLEKMRCWMQDKIELTGPGSSPMQQMRYLEAEEGIYRYTAQQFLAQSVALSLYRIQGRDMPNNLGPYKPFLRGVAQDVSFAVTGKTPQFQAQHFKALLNQQPEDKP